MRQRIVIVGGGVGGVAAANRLARHARGADMVLLDGHGDHIYQPGLVYVPLGKRTAANLTRDLRPLLDRRVDLRVERAARIDRAARQVELEGGASIPYDFLVLATGARVAPEKIPGLREAGFHFHCPRRAETLAGTLAAFDGGTLVLGASRLPYKCPLAPVEAALLLDDLFRRDGRRARIQLRFLYPRERLDPSPRVAGILEGLLRERGIEIHAPFPLERVESQGRELLARSGERLGFDLLVLVPPHKVAPVLERSGLAGESGFVPVDPRSLKAGDGLYALGDNADLPVPKLASAALRQARVVARNLAAELEGRPPRAAYDGRSQCLCETGRGRALLVETAYSAEPRISGPGRLQLGAKRSLNRFYFHLLRRA